MVRKLDSIFEYSGMTLPEHKPRILHDADQEALRAKSELDEQIIH
ncbi:hypothetical protein [Paenibacillus sp. NPDC057934]